MNRPGVKQSLIAKEGNHRLESSRYVSLVKHKRLANLEADISGKVDVHSRERATALTRVPG